MHPLVKRTIYIAIFFGLGLGILFLLYRNLNQSYQAQCILDGIPLGKCNLIEKLLNDFREANIFWLGVITFAFFLSNLSRSERWRFLIESMGYQSRSLNRFFSIMVAYFANLGFPRIGEVVRAGSLARYEKLPFEKVIGTVTMDRILDLITLGFIFLLALVLEYDTLWGFITDNIRFDGLSGRGGFILAGVLFLLAVIALIVWRNRRGVLKYHWARVFKEKISGFGEGLRSVKKINNLSLFLFHSVAIWALYILMTYFCFKAFVPTQHLGLIPALLVCVFGSLGMIIPTPGGMGSYHAMAVAALMIYNIQKEDAFSWAMIIFFTVQIFSCIFLGLIGLIILPVYNRNYHPKRE